MKLQTLFEMKKIGQKNGGFVVDIEKVTTKNKYYRHILYTTKNSQLALMSLKPKEDLGEEAHDIDQFFRIESGNGRSTIDGKNHTVRAGTAIVVPAGLTHNITNTSATEYLTLYTIYSPPNHKKDTIHKTKEIAEKSEEKFDGKVDVS